MRTTLAIDDDVLAAARHLAERDQRSMGDVLSSLAREGLARGARGSMAERNGIPLLPRPTGGPTVVTLDLVNQLRDEPV
jgi:hypothetical protein